jgi:putative transcriptional regulator
MSKKVFKGIMAGLQDALADVRGEPGRVVKTTTIAPVNVRSVRVKTGLSQEEFSRTFGLSLATYRKWEQGQRAPTEASLMLLHVIDRHPKTVLRVAKQVRRVEEHAT